MTGYSKPFERDIFLFETYVVGTKVGYVPKADNVIFSRLMEAGKLLFGKIASKGLMGNWVKIGIKVFLNE